MLTRKGHRRRESGHPAPDEESGVAVGLLNDNDYLYVAFSSRDSDVNRQAMTLGLELWLDPKGDGPASFGIRFPDRARRSNDDGSLAHGPRHVWV